MKYFKSIMLILIILVINIIVNIDCVEAKTLRDLKNELAQKEQEFEDYENKKQLTESEIIKKKQNIAAINNEISEIQQEMLNLTDEIENLGIEIEEKEKEIKDIMNYYQLSNGESAYLEYIFNAKDFTDFIYRMAIAEQLSDYNDKLIDEYNAKIKENEEKKIELENKKVALNKKQDYLKDELANLNNQLGNILEETISVEDEIEVLREYIDTYENKYKCGLDEDINECGRDKLPPGTAFYRPVVAGTVSAHFGWYSPWGTSTWHYGTDFAGTGHGANVYAVANGKVSGILYRNPCGGNMVFVHHIVNGQKYTSGYFHLADVSVRVGDTVTYDTVVGHVGGNPYIETWDDCSTGTHLHLQLAYGLYMQDYTSWSTFTANSFDARFNINLPGVGVWFTNRNLKY